MQPNKLISTILLHIYIYEYEYIYAKKTGITVLIILFTLNMSEFFHYKYLKNLNGKDMMQYATRLLNFKN